MRMIVSSIPAKVLHPVEAAERRTNQLAHVRTLERWEREATRTGKPCASLVIHRAHGCDLCGWKSPASPGAEATPPAHTPSAVFETAEVRIRREAIAAENARCQAIQGIPAEGVEDVRTACIQDGSSVDLAKTRIEDAQVVRSVLSFARRPR